MDRFALLPASEKFAYLKATADNFGIFPELIEKDFWACWILRQLFSLEEFGPHLTFKGGTSLSKCYNAIQRFSEDIDVAIERKYLERGKNIEPSLGESNKENKRRIEELMALAEEAIHKKILPQLRQKVGVVLKNNGAWAIEPDPDDSLHQTLLFMFPVATGKAVNDYVKPFVKIELGARADDWPVQSAKIVPYVAQILPKDLTVEPVMVKVLSAERTFWEKATILHRLYHLPEDKIISDRMSRHYYDLYEMSLAGIFEKALEKIELLQSVVDFNKLFFRYSWLDYDEVKRGSLCLAPKNAEQIKELKVDYLKMQQMFLKKPPTFDQIISGLKSMEERINKA